MFKPHPTLRTKAVLAGIFKDDSEWEDYIKQWEDLENAAYVNDGMYQDLMCKSDAMILDSISFLAEYMYTSHPMLFLKRKEQRFNEFGKLVVEQLYQGMDKGRIVECDKKENILNFPKHEQTCRLIEAAKAVSIKNKTEKKYE